MSNLGFSGEATLRFCLTVSLSTKHMFWWRCDSRAGPWGEDFNHPCAVQKFVEAIQSWNWIYSHSSHSCSGISNWYITPVTLFVLPKPFVAVISKPFILIITSENFGKWACPLKYTAWEIYALSIYFYLGQEANKRNNNWLPPPWALAAMAILGFNEFMTLLRYFLSAETSTNVSCCIHFGPG